MPLTFDFPRLAALLFLALSFQQTATPALATQSDLRFTSWDRQGNCTWTNTFVAGVCSIEAATAITNPAPDWRPQQNYYTTNYQGQGLLPLSPSNHYFRLLAVDISASNPAGYTNLLNSYGLLHTVAGNGAGGTDGVSYWQQSFEGAFATNAALSRPHIAMSDLAGNIFIADKDSHAILKVTLDGRIHTVAGTHIAANGPDGVANALTVALNAPNGLWVRGDGTVYILDTGNSKVRCLQSNGNISTLFSTTTISTGRGLWVKADQSLAFVASGTELRQWTAGGGVQVLNNNFNELGNLIADSADNVIATDRGANKVYSVVGTGASAGTRTLLYGNGATAAVVDGTLARTNSLYGVRGIWPLPTGGYFLGTHEGSQILYVDTAGMLHLFADGAVGAHAGDGQWFHSPGQKVSEVRDVTMDSNGNLLITESDFGFVRRIDFKRLTP